MRMDVEPTYVRPKTVNCSSGGASGHRKLGKPAHQKALEKSLGIKDQSCLMLRLSHKATYGAQDSQLKNLDQQEGEHIQTYVISWPSSKVWSNGGIPGPE